MPLHALIPAELLDRLIALDPQSSAAQEAMALTRYDGVPLVAFLEPEDALEIRHLGQRVTSQDNEFTSEPAFEVREKERIYGLDENYADDTIWVNNSSEEEHDPEIIAALNAAEEQPQEPEKITVNGEEYRFKSFHKVFCKDIEKTVQTFLTRDGAQRFITGNAHRMNEPRISVESFHRNREMIFLRRILPILGQAVR